MRGLGSSLGVARLAHVTRLDQGAPAPSRASLRRGDAGRGRGVAARQIHGRLIQPPSAAPTYPESAELRTRAECAAARNPGAPRGAHQPPSVLFFERESAQRCASAAGDHGSARTNLRSTDRQRRSVPEPMVPPLRPVGCMRGLGRSLSAIPARQPSRGESRRLSGMSAARAAGRGRGAFAAG
jgi:hypothetical protein